MAAAPPPPGAGPSGFPGNPMMINTWNPGSLAAAVWEWQDENNKWRPYSSVVSNYIEQCMQSSQLQKGPRGPGNSSSISLGHVDPHLAPYIIDIVTLTQFRQDTGTMRFVRKSLYPADSAPAKGVCWEWLNDEGYWSSYEMPITIFLEETFCNRNPSADLQVLRLHYHVDFMNMVQTNKITGFLRRVQRRLDTPYPLTSKAAPVHKSAACACYQCLASSGAGPISTRNRHSMGNLPTSSNYQSASRTSLISANNVGYLPYHKPILTSAKSAPKLNSTWLPPSGSMPLPGPSTSNGIRIPSVPVHLQTHSLTQSALAGMAGILMSAAGLPVRLTSAPPSSNPPATSKPDKKSVKKLRKIPKKGGPVEPEQVVKKYLENVEKPSDEDCIICMETLNTASGYSDSTESKTIKPAAVGKLKTCGHVFHQLCMLAMYNNGNKDGSLQCPACKTIYGEKTGIQPKGKMEIFRISQSLPGNQDCGTIHIMYMINPGIQSPEHPTPGKPYTARGFPRHCYLPDNTKGRLVLDLLKLAWSRRLIFTIGVSSTTGESDTVVWNEIHHKTEMNSNITGHGYPDPNYLDNVIAELASQGVTEEGLNM